MFSRGKNKAITLFTNGECGKSGNGISTGSVLTLFGNEIAKWEDGKLFVSSGGYSGRNGEVASKTTMAWLNYLPSARVYQRNFIVYLNGNEWDGKWAQIEGVSAPEIKEGKLNFFNEAKRYVRTDGWRGYEEPVYAVAGANDTGDYDDSPCRTEVAQKELQDVQAILQKSGIKTKQVVCETSNVFCIHRYLIAKMSEIERAREIVQDFLADNRTELLYAVK